MLVPTLFSWGCHNKSPQARGLKTTEIYSLTVGRLEVRNGVGRVTLPLKAPREDTSFLFQLLVDPGSPWLVDVSLQSLSSGGLFSVYLCVLSPLYKDTSRWT